jgi:hypothetical protein
LTGVNEVVCLYAAVSFMFNMADWSHWGTLPLNIWFMHHLVS